LDGTLFSSPTLLILGFLLSPTMVQWTIFVSYPHSFVSIFA
jgi:hypothetical protein